MNDKMYWPTKTFMEKAYFLFKMFPTLTLNQFCHLRCMSTVRDIIKKKIKKKNAEITMYDFLTIY